MAEEDVRIDDEELSRLLAEFVRTGLVYEAAEVARRLEAETPGDTARGTDPLAAQVLMEEKQVTSLLREMHDEAGYRVSAKTNEYKALYRQDGVIHSFIFEMSIDATIVECICLAWEFDLVQSWNKFCVDTMRLAEPALTCLWVYCGIWLPWPITQRQCLIRVRGYDLLPRQGCVAFTLATPTDEALPADAVPLPAAADSRADVDILASGGTLHQITEDTVLARLLINVNPHMRAVPEWLVSFVLSVMVPWVLSMVIRYMRTTFRDPKSAYAQRLKADPSGLYAHFTAQLRAHWDREKNTSPSLALSHLTSPRA